MTPAQALQALALGEQAPDFDLPATDGRTYSLASFAGQELLVIIFSANHCPYVASWEDRMIALGQEHVGRNVAFAVISSTDAQRFPQDSFEEMVRLATDRHYPFPYLYDEDQAAARSYGATRTPEVFVFDRDRRLRYHGAIDSDFEEGGDRDLYLENALAELLAGGPASVPQTKPLGCSLKLKP